MVPIRLLVIVSDPRCRTWFEQSFSGRPDLLVTGFILNVEHQAIHHGYMPEADVIVVDLEQSAESPARFWVAINWFYPRVPILAVIKPSTRLITQQEALQARVDAVVQQAQETDLCEKVRVLHAGQFIEDRYSPVLEAATALFDHPSDEKNSLHGNTMELDKGKRQLRIGRRRIALTLLECEVIDYLLHNADRAVPAAELLCQVWRRASPETRTDAQVKNCIKRLRQKIEGQGERPQYLLTVRGSGYLINCG